MNKPGIPNTHIWIFKKKDTQIIVANKLFKIWGQTMSIFFARFLPTYFGHINNEIGFTFVLIHIIIDVVVLGYKPYVYNKLQHTPFKEFFQSRLQNNSSIRNKRFLVSAYMAHLVICLELCNNQNLIQVKYNINMTHFRNFGNKPPDQKMAQPCYPFSAL